MICITLVCELYQECILGCIYPSPGTESSQSSDEGLAASYKRAITRAIHETDSGVPSVPSQLISASLSSSARNQAMTSTASESESSSSEPQTLKEDVVKVGDQQVVFHTHADNKVDKRPPQKVPRLSSRKLAQIKVHMYMYTCRSA